MPRRLFARLLLHSALVLGVLAVAGGLLLDRFLTANEIDRISAQVERYALLFKENASQAPSREELQAAVHRMGEIARIRFTLVAPSGVVLADSDRDPAAMDNHAARPEVAEAGAGRLGRSIRRSDTLGVDMLYVAVPGNPVVRAAIPMSDVRALHAQVRQQLLFAAIPASLLALALAYLFARSLSRRLEGMVRFSSAVASGDFARVLPTQGDDELADMERTLSALRDQIRERMGELGREKEILVALIDGLPHAVLVLDGDHRLVLANKPALALLRIEAHQALGLPAGELLRAPQILAVLDALTPAGPLPEPFRLTWPEPVADFEVIARPLPDEQGRPGVLVVLRDVTRQVHLEQVRTDFIANLSHELRTPLTAIRGSAETLLSSALSDPVASVRFLDTIRRNALRLEVLLRDVSELSRVESGVASLDLSVLDGGALVGQVVELFAAEAAKAGLRLEPRVPDAPLSVSSDAGKIESILINLVQNAVRYTPTGGVVTVTAEPRPGGVGYTVSDTGPGIPPRDLPRVTERFYRVDPGRSRAVGGTGLGLAIVKHLVELLGGNLEIRSEHGKGTAVQVFVPSVREAAAA